MRVYLVGEGRHDIGDLAVEPPHRTGKPGFLQPIIEKIVGPRAMFEGGKVSLLGKERVRGTREALEGKARLASLLAADAESDLLVFVTDLDRGSGTGKKHAAEDVEKKSAKIRRGHEASPASHLKCVPGVPCRTIEAWALGDLEAVASLIRARQPLRLPDGKGPEDLWGDPRDDNANHPKMVLKRILSRDGTQEDLRQIAERAAIATVRNECPLSFGPFASELESAVSEP